MSRRDSAASRSSSSARGKGAGPRTRSDGKVDVQCPQCAAQYRIAGDKLDSKIECSECHRVFFAKTTVGKRVKPPDNTKVYVGFGVGAVALIGFFVMMSGGGDKPKKAVTAPEVKAPLFSPGDHPRTHDILKWARAIGEDNRLVLQRNSDLPALAKVLGVETTGDEAVLKALQTSESTKYLRELACDSATLASEADMSAATGKAILYVTAKPGDDTYEAKYRGELDVTFRMEGEQVRVTGIGVKLPPVRKKPDPSKMSYVPNKNIEKAKTVTITDSAGTRQVQESTPGPLPHWEKATPEQQKMADEIVAAVLQSADPEAPGTLFSRATLRPKNDDDRKAVVPRLLNAMYELYPDPATNNMKLSQLNRAMVAVIGFGVNYQVEDTGNPEKDKAERQSAVRQWFAFWYKFSNDFSKWRETEENLDMPAKKEEPKKPAK